MESLGKLFIILTSLCQTSVKSSSNKFQQNIFDQSAIKDTFFVNNTVIKTGTKLYASNLMDNNHKLMNNENFAHYTNLYYKNIIATKKKFGKTKPSISNGYFKLRLRRETIKKQVLELFPCLESENDVLINNLFEVDPQIAVFAYMVTTSQNCSPSCEHLLQRDLLPIEEVLDVYRDQMLIISKLSDMVKYSNILNFEIIEKIVYSFSQTFLKELQFGKNYQILYRNVNDDVYMVNQNSFHLASESDYFMRQIFEKLKHEPQSKHFKAICNESWNAFDSMRPSNEMKMWGDLSYDCLTKRWRVLRIEPLYQCVNSSLPPLSGMIKFDIHLDELALDPCSVSKPHSIFQHKCPAHSQCISSQLKTKWKRTSSYACKCLKGYYNKYFMQINLSKESTELNSSNYISGHLMDQTYVDKLLNRSIRWDFECVPCAAGCEECVDDRACNLSFDVLNRGVPLAVESISLTICTALFCSIFKLRKTKVMKGSIWFLLETVVFGAFLLYTTVIIRYFEPNNCLCIVVQWLREVGFACVYGSLILKVYRVLTEFQSRKAHRVQMRNKDLIKCLICIVVVVVGYMAAWTAVNIDSMDGHDWSMLWTVYKDGLKFELCRTASWDYVIILAEILFLSFGIRLCYRARSAPSSHKEIFCITFALCNEVVISGLFYTLRHFLVKQLHPDHLFLMYFLRCQLTVSTLLAAVVGPKLWFAHQPLDDMTLRNRAYSSSEHEHSSPEVVKLNIKPNGDLDNGEFLLTEFNPEDIRYELKRLYTQLQIYKTKTMRQDNPHIPKRRGGRKQTHRRFSLQAFHNKHKRPHSDHGNVSSSGGGGETEVSRTPEESTNSAEGVSVYMDECSALESNNNNNFNNNVNIATNSASRIFTGIVKSKRKNSEFNK